MNSSVAFNSQRLHEACKAKGVLELHLLQKEAAQLQNQYKANVPMDEMNARQLQHNHHMASLYHHHPYLHQHPYQAQQQFHQNPQQQQQQQQYQQTAICQSNIISGQDSGLYFSKAGDLSSYTGLGGPGANKLDGMDPLGKPSMKMVDQFQGALLQQQQPQPSIPGQKQPLQQQLMQHRLLQQKRQILQKQVALETSLSRRQMLRQQSYKIAQQQQILPPLPLPLNELESEDLLAFQAIVEGPGTAGSPGEGSSMEEHAAAASPGTPPPPTESSPKLFKSSHVQLIQQPQSTIFIQPNHQQQQQFGMNPGDLTWSTLSGSMQTCQISENPLNSDTIFHQPIYQVCYMQMQQD